MVNDDGYKFPIPDNAEDIYYNFDYYSFRSVWDEWNQSGHISDRDIKDMIVAGMYTHSPTVAEKEIEKLREDIKKLGDENYFLATNLDLIMQLLKIANKIGTPKA